jgi:hypothetical protein
MNHPEPTNHRTKVTLADIQAKIKETAYMILLRPSGSDTG